MCPCWTDQALQQSPSWHSNHSKAGNLCTVPPVPHSQEVLLWLISTYGGWKKSCTILDGWNPINNGINHLSTGAGFLPSTVFQLPARRNRISAKTNISSMAPKITLVFHLAPCSSPQTSTPQVAQTSGWHRVMDIAMAFPSTRPAWMESKQPKPWAKPPERPKKCCQGVSSE